MPALRKKAMVDPNDYWNRWERFTRYGLKINGRRYTSTQLLQAWALILAVLYILVWLGSGSSGSKSVKRASSNGQFDVDVDFWRDRHLIFCVSPGRAGSKYLRNVFDAAKNVVSRHEPEPKMNGYFLKKVILDGKRLDTFEERARVKLAAIRKTLEGTAPHVAYAETSHMFIKTFSDVVLEKLGDVAKISIIFLRRPVKDTVWSQLRLGWFSHGHSGQNLWYYDPNNVHPSERHISYATNSSDIVETLIAYNADVIQRGVELEREIRSRHKKKQWRRVRMFETLLLDISGDAANAGVLRLLSSMGLSADESKLNLLRDQDRNARDTKKDRIDVQVKIEDVIKGIENMKNKVPLLRQVVY